MTNNHSEHTNKTGFTIYNQLQALTTIFCRTHP